MRNYEHCIECEERTGRAGASDDSLYHGYSGPFCEDCFDAWPDNQVSQIILLRQELKQAQARVAEPVGEITTYPHVGVKFYESTEFGTALPEGTKLYTHPQPAQQGSVTEETVENWRHDSEEMEALHANFDDAGTPRAAQGGEVYSAWGRALRFAEQQGSMPDVGAMADVLGEWVRNTTGTALTNVTLVDMVRVMFATTATPQPEGDSGPVAWTPSSEGPTVWEFRFVEALKLLCGGSEPSDRLVKEWLNHESEDLQAWVASETALHWSMGITTIEAAMSLADEPVEGEDHCGERPQPPLEQGHE